MTIYQKNTNIARTQGTPQIEKRHKKEIIVIYNRKNTSFSEKYNQICSHNFMNRRNPYSNVLTVQAIKPMRLCSHLNDRSTLGINTPAIFMVFPSRIPGKKG
jgi:hypothetical protein